MESQEGTHHTLEELLKAYATDFLPKKSPATQSQSQYLYQFYYLEFGRDRALHQFTPEFLRLWRDSLTRRFSPRTVRRYMDVLRAPFTQAVKYYRWLQEQPFERVAYPPGGPDRVRSLTPEERTRLLVACQMSRNRHLYLIVLVALSTGMRKSEIRGLRWGHLDLDEGVIRLEQTKTGRPRAVVCRGLALDGLRARWLDEKPALKHWVFPRGDGLKPIEIDHAWKQACRQARLEDFHFHDLRHTVATELYKHGASPFDIQEVLGHATLAMTRKYTHLEGTRTRQVIEKMLQNCQLQVPLLLLLTIGWPMVLG